MVLFNSLSGVTKTYKMRYHIREIFCLQEERAYVSGISKAKAERKL